MGPDIPFGLRWRRTFPAFAAATIVTLGLDTTGGTPGEDLATNCAAGCALVTFHVSLQRP